VWRLFRAGIAATIRVPDYSGRREFGLTKCPSTPGFRTFARAAMRRMESFTLADRDWLAEMHVTVPDADAFESAPPVEAEADPIPAPVTQMLAVPPAAGPIAGPVEAAASIGRCILIGWDVAVGLFVVMIVV